MNEDIISEPTKIWCVDDMGFNEARNKVYMEFKPKIDACKSDDEIDNIFEHIYKKYPEQHEYMIAEYKLDRALKLAFSDDQAYRHEDNEPLFNI